MKVALVNNQLQLGGAETVVQQLRAGLTARGHRTSLHVALGKSYPRDVQPLYPRVLSRLAHTRLHPLVERVFPRDRWTDAAFRRLADSDANIVHVHNFHGSYASIDSLAFLATRKPVAWTFHGLWGVTGGCVHPKECTRYRAECGECPHLGEWPLTSVDNTAEQLAAKLTHLAPARLEIIAPSAYFAAHIRASRVGREWRVHHIPNGVDAERFRANRKGDAALRRSLGLDPTARIVLIATRSFRDPEKGFATIRTALSQLALAGLQLVLIGEHSTWARQQLPATTSCVDVGYVTSREQIAGYMEAADVFLFASAAENFPCIILEAMSAGCCVVATPSGGVVEQIKHGKTGVLAAHNDGASLALALNETLSHPSLLPQIGEAARRTAAEEFSEALMVANHVKLYEQMLAP